MDTPSDNGLDKVIEAALTRQESGRAPEGFARRVDDRLRYAQLRDRQRRQLILAAGIGVAGLLGMAVVAALFWYAIDVPGWVVEQVPGVLGRLDRLQIIAARNWGVALAAGTAVVALAALVLGTLNRRRRRAGSS